MTTSYQGYGAGPGNAYPNASRYDSPNVYPPNDHSLNDNVPPHLKEYSNTSDVRVDMRTITRTPSPTPSETTELKKEGLFDFQAMKSTKFWFRKEWLWYYVAFAILTAVTIAFTVFHKQIVKWLQPAANWMHGLPAGWLIPIAILFVISFPPLFGHEIIAILCGVVWGLWPGFAIVAAGTFIGEVGNFYAFKYCCAARGEKMERTKIQYACLARVVREGGFKIALIARFSAIPGHFTTAVFSTCGMGIWTFMLAALLSLPKQFITVYLGVALENSEDGKSSTKDTIIQDAVIGVTTVVTIAAMWYIYRLMNTVKPLVIYDRRKARQAKLEAGIDLPYNNSSILASTASLPFNPRKSDSELPLNASFGNPSYQQWDSAGRAVGYAPDPTLYAPQPQRPMRVSPAGSSSASPRNAGTPAMSERDNGRAPIRQNTSSSTASWDPRTLAGGPDAYPMSRSKTSTPYEDPYSAPPKLPPPQSFRPPQRQGASPISPQTAPGTLQSSIPTSTEPTPTQAQFATYRPPAGPPPGQATSPQSGPLPNPYTQNQQSPYSAPTLPSNTFRGHGAESTDAAYYTTAPQSRDPSDAPYGGYSSQQQSYR